MFIAKNNAPIAKNKNEKWNVDTITQLLTERLIINGFECLEIIKFKPIETDLDVLFVRNDQILDGLLVQIANEFGKNVFPEITKETRDADGITPITAIKLCMTAHGFRAENEGIFILTNRRSAFLGNIYANETSCNEAKQLGITMVNENMENICVYVDPDVRKRFTAKPTPASQPPVAENAGQLLDLLKPKVKSLYDLAEALKYQDDTQILDFSTKLATECEAVNQIVTQMILKMAEETLQAQTNINHLEHKVKTLKHNNDTVCNEMEEQLTTQEETIKNCTRQILELQRKQQTPNIQPKSEDDTINELKTKIDVLADKTSALQVAVEGIGDTRVVRDPTKVSISDVRKMIFPSDESKDIVAVMSNKEASLLMPKWQTQDNINGYCKRIESAWSFCSAETFDEAKFCQILRLGLPTNCGEIFDNMEDADKKKVNAVVTALKEKLDKQSGEYLQMFSQATKMTGETHNQFAIRIQRLYKFGTGQDSAFTERDQKLMVEAYLKGLPQNESTALRLVASDAEMKNIDQIAKRASRSTQTQTNVNAVSNEKTDNEHQLPDKQALFRKGRFQGSCYFCNIKGHTWRRCHKKANTNPQWKPQTTTTTMPTKTTTETA